MFLSRRSLLSKIALAAAPGLTAADASVEAGHTLVHVFLRGGADTLNLLVPHADDRYRRLRPGLALSEREVIRLDDHYGLHPALRPLEAAWKEGRFGAVQSVGIDNTSGSHFDCQDQMEHGDSMHSAPAGGGWLGRCLRLQDGAAASALAAVAVGRVLPECLRGAPAVSVLEKLDDLVLRPGRQGDPERARQALAALYGAEVSLLGRRGVETIDLFERVRALQGRGGAPENGAVYPSDPFGDGLREIARLIKAQVGLRVACLDLGGWDTHFFQGGATGPQAERIGALAEGLAAFERDLRTRRGRYTVMVTTEFGRRLYENASLGTDHGRGFAFLALGDRVRGGRVLGGWPIRAEEDLNLNTPGPGGLHAETDFRRVFAEVLRSSFDLRAGDLAKVFPGADLSPVGLMGEL
jgi:uncharacterized protein (DUF1501 family)